MNSAASIETSYCFKAFDATSLNNSNEEVYDFPVRCDMQEIIPGLYLGPYLAAKRSNLNKLLEAGITHIVCVRHNTEAATINVNCPDKFEYLVVDLLDGNIIPEFPKVNCFIDKCFRARGKVLVHGHLGISRSAALVIAYLMERRGLSYSDANSLVLSKRYCVKVNDVFVNQLKEYEPIYKARFIYSRGHSSKLSGNQGKHKRRYEDAIDSDYNAHMEIGD